MTSLPGTSSTAIQDAIDAIVESPREEPVQPFRLFDLPSELRIRVYEYALAPTQYLRLDRTKTKRFAVEPSVTPQLLATCRQVHHEAHGILYEQNEVCIAVDAHDACWSVVPENRLPQWTLEKLHHMCVVLDCTNYFNLSYADTDLTAFEALVSLRTLRLAMVYRRNHGSQVLAPLHIASLREFNLIAQLLERIPASTQLTFGTAEDSVHKEIVRDVIERRKGGIRGTYVEAPPADLQSAAIGVKDLVRGCRSGRTSDVYADSRFGSDALPRRV